METDGEGKFVSFKRLFFAVHRSSKWITVPPVSIAWSVVFFGALEQLRDWSWWIQGLASEEKTLQKFVFVGKLLWAKRYNITLTEKKELEVLPSLDHSLTHVRSLCRWVRAHWSGEREKERLRERDRERERERANSKNRQKRSAQVDVLCLFFRCTARWWPVRNDLFFINGVVDGASGERFLTITFRVSSVKYRVYFFGGLFVFPHSRNDFQKKLDEKHKKQTSCPNEKQFNLQLSQARSIAGVAHVAGRAWVHAKVHNWS